VIWSKWAARRGHTRAMSQIGTEEWLRRAAEAGLHHSAERLGHLLRMEGRFREAEELLRPATEAALVDAFSDYGLVLERIGRVTEAEVWLRRGAASGEYRAIHALGAYLERNGHDTEAAEWLARAESQGKPLNISRSPEKLSRKSWRAAADLHLGIRILTGQMYQNPAVQLYHAFENGIVLVGKRGKFRSAHRWEEFSEVTIRSERSVFPEPEWSQVVTQDFHVVGLVLEGGQTLKLESRDSVVLTDYSAYTKDGRRETEAPAMVQLHQLITEKRAQRSAE